MNGLGDAIYHRPFAHDLCRRSYLDTRWPDLFSDLPWLSTPTDGLPPTKLLRARYRTGTLALHTVPGAIARHFPVPTEYRFDLPAFPRPDGLPQRYAVIRAATLRTDFYSPSRNPLPEYLQQAAAELRGRGFAVVGVSKVSETETFAGEPPAVDIGLWRGELRVSELMGLIAGAEVVVAGPGWTVPAAMAYRTPHVIVQGGAARWNSLSKLVDPRMGQRPVVEVCPDRFCGNCRTVDHDCDKTITDFPRRLSDAVDHALRMRERGLP